MIKVGDEPIVMHIMRRYANYGYKEFILALGYKASKFREFFANYKTTTSDMTVDLRTGQILFSDSIGLDWKVTLVDTGTETMTGGRIKRLKPYLNDTFFLTYGDGLSDVNINDLLRFHRSHDKSVTLTAVRPNARFGELQFDNDSITGFDEKPQLAQGWINGGFFVMDPDALNYMLGDHEMLEREPMDRIVKDNQLAGYKHTGFWQCMDTKRDHERLERLYNENPIWLK